MVWARLDDRFPWNRKIRSLSDRAFRLDVEAICWSNEQLTDGQIPRHELDQATTIRNPSKYAAELVTRGRWETAGDGWLIHDFLDYNLSRAQVLAERDRAKKKRLKSKRPPDAPVDAPADRPPDAPVDRPGPLAGARPVPTRPEGEGRTGLPDRDPHPLRTAPEREPNSPSTSRPSTRRSA